MAARVITGHSEEDAVRGEMLFSGCRFEKSRRNGVVVGRKPASGIKLAFDQYVLADCASHTNIFPDILLSNTISDEQPADGIRLDRMTILQPVVRPWLRCQNNAPDRETVTALTGTVKVKQGKTWQKVKLTPEWVKAQFPPRFPVRVPRVAVDLAKARMTDRAEGVQKLPLPPFKQRAEIRFTPAAAGYYTLEVDVGGNAFTLFEANMPVALDTTKKAVSLIASAGTLFAAIPKGTGVFAFGLAGEGDGETVKATVTDPSGKPVWTNRAITQMERFTAKEGQGEPGGLWQVTAGRPSKGVFKDFHLEVLGIPGYLFLNRERYWEF